MAMSYEQLEKLKEFYKHVALYLDGALRGSGPDSYRLWAEAVNDFHEKHGEEKEFKINYLNSPTTI